MGDLACIGTTSPAAIYLLFFYEIIFEKIALLCVASFACPDATC
jgi:hypothetical protein